METVLNDLVNEALEVNAAHALIAKIPKIPFNEDFRELCKKTHMDHMIKTGCVLRTSVLSVT